MSVLKLTNSFVVAMLLAGCGTAYVAPSDGPTANLAITMAGGVLQTAAIYSRAEDCTGSQFIGEIGPDGRMVVIRAGTPISFIMGANNPRSNATGLSVKSCTIVLTFTPVQGHSYFANYQFSEYEGKCTAEITETVQGSSSRTRVNAIARKYVTPLTASSPACTPIQ